MHVNPIYTWSFAATAIFLWIFGIGWFLRNTGFKLWWRRDLNADKLAETEAMVMAWSEPKTREVMERFPNSPGPVLVYAEHALKRKDFEEATRRYRIAIECNRADIRGYLGAERALREAGQFDAAEELLREACRRFPRDQRVLGDHARNARQRGDWPECARRWEHYRKRFPTDKLGYVEGAEALLKAGNVADADALRTDASARFPELAATATADR